MTVTAGANLIVPSSVRKLVISPKTSRARDEYTPAQRRTLDAELAEAAKGPVHGPFDSATEMIAHMKARLKQRETVKKPKTSR